MDPAEIYPELEHQKIDAERLAKQCIHWPEFIPVLIGGLAHEKARVKYGCAKALRILSDKRPELLYANFDFFADLLDHKNRIFQWEATYLLAGLASADKLRKIDQLLDKYCAPIEGPVMITANNVIKGVTRIAAAKPYLADRIAECILRVQHGRYETSECYEITCGLALKAFDEMFDVVSDPKPLLRFARAHLDSPRNATRKVAEKFLGDHTQMERVLA